MERPKSSAACIEYLYDTHSDDYARRSLIERLATPLDSSNTTISRPSPSHSTSSPPGVIAGGVIAGIIGVLLVTLGLYLYFFRRKHNLKRAQLYPNLEDNDSRPELKRAHRNSMPELQSPFVIAEMEYSSSMHELSSLAKGEQRRVPPPLYELPV